MGKSMLHAERAKEKEGRCERRPKSQPRREEGDGRWGAERAKRDIGELRGGARTSRSDREKDGEGAKERPGAGEMCECKSARRRERGSGEVKGARNLGRG